MAYECQVPNLIKKFFIQKEKNTKLAWPLSAKSDTQLPGFIYNEIRIFFGSLLKTFPLETLELTEKLEWIKKNITTWGSGHNHLFELWRFERGGRGWRRGSHISIFYSTNILPKTFIPYCSHDCPKTFPHIYVLLRYLVLYKKLFCKTNIFYSLENRI